MQRYRINYQWLIGVFVSAMVFAVAAYFVWSWQMNRNAGDFLTRAEAALADDNPLDAFTWYHRYVQLRPEEDDARVKMASAAIEVVKSKDVTFEERSLAFGVLDQTVRRTDDPELRRELAKIVISFRPQDAIGHIEDLLVDSPQDSELNAMMVRALFAAKDYDQVKKLAFNLVGYDKKADEFDTEKSSLEGESDVYALLADVLMQKDGELELSQRVIDQMVTANPDDPTAHLRKSIFLSSQDEEGATESLNKAFELDPTNTAILRRKGMVALSDSTETEDEEESAQKVEEAKKYFALGIKEHPEDVLFYQLMAQAEHRLKNSEEALRILDEGINKFDKNQSIDLVIYKIELLLGSEDYAAIDREIKRLNQLNRPELQPIVDYQEARVLFSKQEWAAAAKELKRIRPLLFNRPKFQLMAGTMLGICYESQGILDLALEAYTTVLDDYPKHVGAQKGRERVLARIQPNQEGEADLDEIVNNTLALPEAEQDWDKVDELVDEVIEKNNLEPARQKLLRAKVLIKRGHLAEAKQLIRDAAKEAPDDISVQYAAILLVLSDSEQGPVPASKLLDRLEKKWGRTLRSIAQRADLIAVENPEDVTDQLRALGVNAAELTDEERMRLDKVLGLKFEQLGKLAEAQEYYEKAIEQETSNLPLRMHLFDLAVRQRDDAAMLKAQQSILDFVKSKNDPSYVLTEVKRRIMSYSRGELTKAEVAECRGMLDSALKQRPNWHELHITYGQLLLLLGDNIDLALKHFDDALDSGPAKSNAVAIQVRLLVDRKLFAQARQRMELLSNSVRSRLLGKLEAEVLINTGDQQAAFDSAKKIADSKPNDGAVQLWFSKMAQRVGKLDVASDALRKSLEITPSDPDNWVRLIGLAIEQKKFQEVQDVIREAHLACDAEFLPMLTAKYDELLSRWQNAESIYLAVYADQTENLAVARRLADFYLLWTKRDEANLGKAAVYINQILRAANEGKVQPDNPHVVWARQKAARILFAKQDYQQSLKAEQLLRQSANNNAMNSEESSLLVDILIARDDPKSLLKAEELLIDLREKGQLTKKDALQLARLLSRTDKWDQAKPLLLELISDHPNDPAIRTAYVELLIEHDEFTGAERALRRLQDMNTQNSALIQLSARLASERGDQAQLVQMLRSMVPKQSGAMSEAQLKNMLGVAQLATVYGAYDLAGELYQTYTERVPSEIFQLARFHAYHGDCGVAVEIMKRLFDDRMDDVVQLANRMLGARREEIGDKYDADVDRMLRRALNDDPDSVTRQLARAEAFESQGKHDESIATYDQLLSRDDLPTKLRAMAMNNLGFQLGLLNQRVDEAEQLVNDAMHTFGPVEDMLDTRAVVRIAQQKYDLAIEDMELALAVSQDPIKFFHLAKAYALAGNGQAALKAWEQAQKNGFEKDALPRLEKPSFEQVLQQIESLRTQSANL